MDARLLELEESVRHEPEKPALRALDFQTPFR